MNSQTWLWLNTILMLAGGLAILAIGRQRTAHEQAHTIYSGIVPIIAACSYLAMAVGQGSIILSHETAGGTGRLFYFARYVDWAFTTPLLLLGLAFTAMPSGMRRGGLVAGLLLADLLMIVTAFLFGVSDIAWIKWTWFIVSCGAFAAVFYVMWLPLLRETRQESAAVQSDYRRGAAILSVLWLAYPLLLAIDNDGLGLIGETAGVALIAILDLVSKVAYGLLEVSSMRKTFDRAPVVHAASVTERVIDRIPA